MAAPNIINVSSASLKTAVQSVGTTATAIVTNAAASGKAYVVTALYVSNVDGANAADITVDFYRSAAATEIVKTVSVPADASLVPIIKDAAINLEEGDSIRLTGSATGDLKAVCSYAIYDDA